MNSAVFEPTTLQSSASLVIAPAKKRLVAQWYKEADKLVCRWVSV